MKNQVSKPAMIGAIAVAAVIIAVIGYRLFGPEPKPQLQTAPIKMAITPPEGGRSQPASGAIQINVTPP